MGKAGLIALAGLLLAAAAEPPSVAPIPDEALINANNAARIAQLMKQQGWMADLITDKAGDPYIRTGFGGTRANVWFHDCNEQNRACLGIQLQLGVIMEKKLTLAEVNAFNSESRFASLSLDEEGDAILRQDISLAGQGISAAALTDTIRAFEEQARALMKQVVARENGSD